MPSRSLDIYHHPKTVLVPTTDNKKIPLDQYLKQTCPSLYDPKLQYKPTPYLPNGHLQTIAAALYEGSSTIIDIEYNRKLLELEKGGVVSVDWVIPKTPLPDNTPTVIFLHGLTGGSHESYILSVLQIICKPPFNYRAVVFNARGCGFTNIQTAQLFNASITDDLRQVISYVQSEVGKETPLIGIGFSLGSNILVKYLGEEKEKTPLIAAISVANPYDTKVSSDYLDEGLFTRLVYSHGMGKNLKRIFLRNKDIILANRKDIDLSQVLAAKTIRDYDDAYTKKMFYYSTVDNYYRDASCVRVIEQVKIPLLCINAVDDPISVRNCIAYDEIKNNPNIILVTTKYGGHLGWFEHWYHPSRWVDKPISEFILAMFKPYDNRPGAKTIDPNVVTQSAISMRKPMPRAIKIIANIINKLPLKMLLSICVVAISWFVLYYQPLQK